MKWMMGYNDNINLNHIDTLKTDLINKFNDDTLFNHGSRIVDNNIMINGVQLNDISILQSKPLKYKSILKIKIHFKRLKDDNDLTQITNDIKTECDNIITADHLIIDGITPEFIIINHQNHQNHHPDIDFTTQRPISALPKIGLLFCYIFYIIMFITQCHCVTVSLCHCVTVSHTHTHTHTQKRVF